MFWNRSKNEPRPLRIEVGIPVEVVGVLNRILIALETIAKGQTCMTQAIEFLVEQVERNTSVVGSVLTLIQGLRGQLANLTLDLQDAGVNTMKIEEVTKLLAENSDRLAQAVAANTTTPEVTPVETSVETPIA